MTVLHWGAATSYRYENSVFSLTGMKFNSNVKLPPLIVGKKIKNHVAFPKTLIQIKSVIRTDIIKNRGWQIPSLMNG